MNNEHNNAPDVPQGEPVACLVRQRTLRTRAAIAYDGQDHFSEWSDWYPATLKYGTAVTDPRRNSGPEHLFEMLTLVLATQSTAPAQEVGLTEQRTYRLLQEGIDKIEAADEFLSDDTNTWAVDPNGIFVGVTYMGNVLRPARRAIIAALRAKGAV